MDLRKLNSATKYPSIETYHDLDPKTGKLLESGNPFLGETGPVYVTEKVDGVNARIIFVGTTDWYIGSREELLTASGDRVYNVEHDIVDTLRPLTAYGPWETQFRDNILVCYVEVYGHRRTPAWKTYGDGKNLDYRLFDIASIPLEVLDWDIERIALWRERGGQEFWSQDALKVRWPGREFKKVPGVVAVSSFEDLPVSVKEMRDFLGHWAPQTRVAIDQGSADPMKNPEGLVFRTEDRSIIRKARYQSYDYTLTSPQKVKKNRGVETLEVL